MNGGSPRTQLGSRDKQGRSGVHRRAPSRFSAGAPARENRMAEKMFAEIMKRIFKIADREEPSDW